jgi:DNA-binding NtrC family response regulator
MSPSVVSRKWALCDARRAALTAPNGRPCSLMALVNSCALILGDSTPMQLLREHVVRFAPTALPILVLGPTGSGKGMVAQAIHDVSGRRGRFVVANVAALGEGLVDSELFGHVRGAFTSSHSARRGLLLHADGGSLFLDEVHRLSAHVQPKLLRALETSLVRPVGSDTEIRSGFRLITAANEDLEVLADAGRFQDDLLARLSRLIIHVPALSEHRSDIPVLAQHFLAAMGAHPGRTITGAAVQALQAYDWPRNVRELQTVVERCAVLTDGPVIDREHVQVALSLGQSRSVGRTIPMLTGGVSPRDLRSFDHRERLVRDALVRSNGKVAGAAQLLGTSAQTLYRWLQDLGMPTPERQRSRPRALRTADEVPPEI